MISIWLLSGQIGSLQATQMAHEATIRNLDQEQSRLKEKISRLEEEREVLLSQSQTANDQHKQQVLKLEQVLFFILSLSVTKSLFTSSNLPLVLSLCARNTRAMRRSSPGWERTMRRRHFASRRRRSEHWRSSRRNTRWWERKPSKRKRRRRNSSSRWVQCEGSVLMLNLTNGNFLVQKTVLKSFTRFSSLFSRISNTKYDTKK